MEELEVIEEFDVLGDTSLQSVTSGEFNTAMEELIALEEAQLEALEYTYSMQLFTLVVVVAVAVVLLFHKVIKIFM